MNNSHSTFIALFHNVKHKQIVLRLSIACRRSVPRKSCLRKNIITAAALLSITGCLILFLQQFQHFIHFQL